MFAYGSHAFRSSHARLCESTQPNPNLAALAQPTHSTCICAHFMDHPTLRMISRPRSKCMLGLTAPRHEQVRSRSLLFSAGPTSGDGLCRIFELRSCRNALLSHLAPTLLPASRASSPSLLSFMQSYNSLAEVQDAAPPPTAVSWSSRLAQRYASRPNRHQ